MRAETLKWCEEQPDLSISERAVLKLLCELADTNNSCKPSQQEIADRLCCSSRTVMRKLKALESRGLIKRKERFYKKNRLTDKITVNVKEGVR